MATGIEKFTPEVLSSYNNLQKYLRSGNEIQEVLKYSTKGQTPPRANLRGRWVIENVLTFPLRVPAYLFFKALALICELFCAKSWSVKWDSLAHRVKPKSHKEYLSEAYYLSEIKPGFFIARSTNKPAPSALDVSSQKPLPISSLKDPKVRKRTFCYTEKEIIFSDRGGICRGMSEWFLYLYLTTVDQFSSPRECILAVAKQFEKGAPSRAALLQSIFILKGKILDIKIPIKNQPQINCNLLDNNPALVTQILANASAGVYTLSVLKHLCVYIKISDKEGYLFDPNFGVAELKDQQARLMLSLILKFYHKKGEKRSTIGLEPITHRKIKN